MKPRGAPVGWIAGAAAAAMVLAGCGGGPPSALTNLSRRAQSTGPGAVAVRYFFALYNGQFAKARPYLTPGSQASFRVLSHAITNPAFIQGNDIRAGNTTIHGSAATTVIIGSVCTLTAADRPPGGPGTTKTADGCVMNISPHSTSALFTVHLTKTAAGKWLVVLPPAANLPTPRGG